MSLATQPSVVKLKYKEVRNFSSYVNVVHCASSSVAIAEVLMSCYDSNARVHVAAYCFVVNCQVTIAVCKNLIYDFNIKITCQNAIGGPVTLKSMLL